MKLSPALAIADANSGERHCDMRLIPERLARRRTSTRCAPAFQPKWPRR